MTFFTPNPGTSGFNMLTEHWPDLTSMQRTSTSWTGSGNPPAHVVFFASGLVDQEAGGQIVSVTAGTVFELDLSSKLNSIDISNLSLSAVDVFNDLNTHDWTALRNLLTAGNDAIEGTALNDVLTGGAGNDNISGYNGNDKLMGGSGSDTLDGGRGHDTLTGGGGDDHFWFQTAGNDPGVVSIVTDFKHGHDQIDIHAGAFGAIGSIGAMHAAYFHQGTTATTADQRILYDQATGHLAYDADGNGNAVAPFVFAYLGAGTVLTLSDMYVI